MSGVSAWWSVGLAVIAVGNTWLIGNRWAPAWIVAVGAQVLWFIYGAATGQWGFAGSAVIFMTLNARNYLRWRRLDREEVTSGACHCVRERV